MLRINNIKMSVNSGMIELENEIKRILGIKEIKALQIAKKSIDARHKNDVYYVFSVDVTVDNEQKVLTDCAYAESSPEPVKYVFPAYVPSEMSPVIIGTGPAGLFAGLVLAQNGYKPIMLERGASVEERTRIITNFWNGGSLDENTNVQFGEGGAGTFSDGKLTTGIKDFRIRKVLDEFVRFGAPEEIKYLSKPHIGTDILKKVVRGIREEIISLGGRVLFKTIADDFLISNSTITGIVAKSDNKTFELLTDKVILAAGHSARDTFLRLKQRGIEMMPKPFSLGVRIEHDQEMISSTQYGDFYKYMGAADYKLSAHLSNGRGVYTFCMCPGGYVVNASSEKGAVVTNGMSNYARDAKNANSAVLVSVSPADFPSNNSLSGIELQRKAERLAFLAAGENYSMPIQTVGDFLHGRSGGTPCVLPTVLPGTTLCDFCDILPEYVINSLREGIIAFDKKIPGFADAGAVMTAPETRSSSPVRIIRNEKHETNIKGFFSAGEGGGHAGGIISSAVDGIKTAEMMVEEVR